MQRILVTGGNGHLGNHLVRVLSQKGYRVRATVRNLNDPSKIKPLRGLENVELVQAELLDPESLARAMVDVKGVFHAAAPTLSWSTDPIRDIIRPSFEGTKNVLSAAKNAHVEKIVFTSNCASCGMNTTADKPFTESDWNLSSRASLVKSKIDAERWAWDFSKANGMNLITLNPPTILGPGFYQHTTSTQIYEKILLGKLPPLPEGGCHLVDVRDLAEAHVRAYENPNTSGRYIVAGEFFKISEFMVFLRKTYPHLRVPNFQLPVWALQGIRFADWARHQIMGKPRELTGEIISEFVGKFQYVSTHKAQRELGWKPRSSTETIQDTLQWVNDQFLNKEKRV